MHASEKHYLTSDNIPSILLAEWTTCVKEWKCLSLSVSMYNYDNIKTNCGHRKL